MKILYVLTTHFRNCTEIFSKNGFLYTLRIKYRTVLIYIISLVLIKLDNSFALIFMSAVYGKPFFQNLKILFILNMNYKHSKDQNTTYFKVL